MARKPLRPPPAKSTLSSTLNHIVQWLIGVLFILFGITLSVVNLGAAALWLIAGLVLLPPMAKYFTLSSAKLYLTSLSLMMAGLLVAVIDGVDKQSNKTVLDTVQELGTTLQTTAPPKNSPSKTTQASNPKTNHKTHKNSIHCRIVKVSDGDTATCLSDDKTQLRIRLWQIDAPEKGQSFGNAAKQALAELIFDKQVMLNISSTDKYGRYVGEIFVGHQNVNKQMVKIGMAWAYREYLKDDDYLRLEQDARRQRLGLWIDKNPVYPSDFRKQKQN